LAQGKKEGVTQRKGGADRKRSNLSRPKEKEGWALTGYQDQNPTSEERRKLSATTLEKRREALNPLIIPDQKTPGRKAIV